MAAECAAPASVAAPRPRPSLRVLPFSLHYQGRWATMQFPAAYLQHYPGIPRPGRIFVPVGVECCYARGAADGRSRLWEALRVPGAHWHFPPRPNLQRPVLTSAALLFACERACTDPHSSPVHQKSMDPRLPKGAPPLPAAPRPQRMAALRRPHLAARLRVLAR